MRKNRILFVLLLLIAVFGMVTMQTGHVWGDDFAMYLMHARNIAEGHTYDQTGYIYNDLAPAYAPQSYPPGFPLLIAPVYAIFGYDFMPYKIFILLLFLVWLVVIYRYLRDKMPELYALAVIAILGFNPFLWEMRNSILSDIPAALFFTLAIVLTEKAFTGNKITDWIIAGCVIYFSYAIRSTGIVLLPAAVIAGLFYKNTRRLKLLIPVIVFFLLIPVQSLLFHQEGSYFTIIANTLTGDGAAGIADQVRQFSVWYFDSFKDFFIGSYHNLFTNSVLFYAGFSAATLGFIFSLRKKVTTAEIAVVLYVGVILLWPAFQGFRFFVPLMPLYLLYIVVALQQIKKEKIGRIAASAFMVLMIAVYISYYITADYGTPKYNIEASENKEVFNYIRSTTEDHALIMSEKPRAFCLETGRRGIVFPDPAYADSLQSCIRENNVEFIATSKFNLITNYPMKEILSDHEHFQLVYENKAGYLFRVNRVTF